MVPGEFIAGGFFVRIFIVGKFFAGEFVSIWINKLKECS
jgi:hypothetical protein